MSTLDLSGISWVRLSFVDVFGTAHSMQIPASRFSEAAEQGVAFDGSSLEGRAGAFLVQARPTMGVTDVEIGAIERRLLHRSGVRRAIGRSPAFAA